MEFDPLLLSRIQFAFTMAFHILFPAFTIGLASWLVMLEAIWLITGREMYHHLYKFWMKIFAVSFGMGVVSGIVMSFQFGTNWSRFSETTGNIIGPLLNYEVLTAFFLEASFLGIMLFGSERVGKKFHFFATCMVALGVLISTFWIISANSWMQTPAGYEIRDGIFYPANWWEIVFNPSFPYRLAHMVLAAYLTTCFVIGGISAGYLLQQRFVPQARFMLIMTVVFAAIVAPSQLFSGDLHGLNVRDYQPAKLAAMEAHWETRTGAPLILFALPDAEQETNHLEIAVPKLGSLILTHGWDGEVLGLKTFPRDERPPVAIVFWSFRIMVGIGMIMLFVGFYGVYLWWRGELFHKPWFLKLCRLMTPAGFIAVLAGWGTAEVGRQPYVVYGLMRTSEASTVVAGSSVFTSLVTFFLVYTVVFSAGIYYILRLIQNGPDTVAIPTTAKQIKQFKRLLSLPDDAESRQ
ncbi:MAG: cytochrome ubiquinol oxidase subunit I [Candidatus Competibacteraceae bacterium]|jgi:cytochrome d ubiquinol oxidase subunit I|nr:cytochrome ubiquinol oxidase subunit I [Candidatus Competibacteraceae bacterium]